MASVMLSGISKTYDGSNRVIKGLDLRIADGEFMVFVGPSGCGKSTLMRMIAGLEDITSGELRIGHRLANDLPPVERKVAMVFQSYALYPHMSVAENMGFGLRINGTPKAEVKAAVGKAAEILQITHLLDRKPKALSGGQRQRVAIGRAIVRKPDVFLFDEPLSNLDAGLRVQMRVELSKLHKELGSTMIYVTHDQTEAMTMGNRIAVFNQGRIEQVGAPMDLYEQPDNVFVAQFLGSPRMNLLPARMRPQGETLCVSVDGLGELNTAADGFSSAGAVVSIGLRPESIVVSEVGAATDPGWVAAIELIEQLGDTTLLYVNARGLASRLCIKLPESASRWRPGQSIRLAPQRGALQLFDANERRLGAV